jgi:hypothetical protein
MDAVIYQGDWDAKSLGTPLGAALIVVHHKQGNLSPAAAATVGQSLEIAPLARCHHTKP